MKKSIVLILVLALAFASAASAETLTTLKQVQDVIIQSSTRALMYGADVNVRLTGTVAEVISVEDLWYIYRIECDEDDARDVYMFGYAPSFYTRGYDLNIGDFVRVEGKLNILYSSPLMPYITPSNITPLS